MAVRPKPRSTRLLVVVFISLSLATITLDYKEGDHGPLAGLGRGALALMAPMQQAVTDVTRPVNNFFIGLAHLSSLEQRNQQLENEVTSLRSRVRIQTSFEADYLKLKQLLGVKDALQTSTPVTAQVIASGLSNFEWTITIAAGSAHGIAVGDPVVAGPAIAGQPRLVGHVIKVAPNASVVELEIDRDSFVGSRLADSGATGLVQGQGQDDMQLTLVDPSVEAPLNELVVTSGFRVAGERSLYPAGIVVGQVSQFVPPTNDLQAFIKVRPAVDFSQLQYVLVLTRGSG